MEIGGIVAEKVELCYEGLNTWQERQAYQERLARDLTVKHELLLYKYKLEPVFYVEGVPSRINFHPTMN
jgi:hypothetical protein